MICGVIATIFMLFILAFVLTVKDLPAAAASVFSSLAIGFGGFIGGFFSSRKAGHKGLLFGFITGVFLYIIVLCASLIVTTGGFTILSLIKLAITLLSSAIGGVIGVNIKNRRKYI